MKQQITLDLVRKLLSEGTINDKIDDDGHTVLHLAIMQKQTEAVKALLASSKLTKETINDKDLYGNTAFYFAVTRGEAEIVQALLASSKVTAETINDTMGKCKDTALHLAIVKGNLESVKALLTSDRVTKETINTTNSYGNTVLHIAIKQQQDTQGDKKEIYMEIIQTLLQSNKLTAETINAKDGHKKNSS